jgi:hypothetical protein
LIKDDNLDVEHAAVQGHKVVDPETGAVQGEVSNTMNWIPLPSGEYTVELQGKSISFKLKRRRTEVLIAGFLLFGAPVIDQILSVLKVLH